MLKFDPNKYNEIRYQVAQALLWKVTDAILSVFVESKESNLILKVYLDIEKTSILEEKLMAYFETEARERLSDYEIEFLVANFFYLAFMNIVGMFVSYMLEVSARSEFLQRRALAYEKRKSESLLFAYLDNTIKYRLVHDRGNETCPDSLYRVR